MADIVLTTDRLELRQIGEDDLDAHCTHLNTPAVMAHLGGVKTRDEIAEKQELSRSLFAEHGFGFMLAFERNGGELVGHCGMKIVSNPLALNVGDHEIGWLVREDRWRMGYANEAMRAVVDWAFAVLSVPHLAAITCEANIGSWKLMEKLGMQRAKELDYHDPAFDAEHNPAIQYRLTQPQWEQTK